MITKRLAVLSFAGIQSSVITITNALFDLASSSRSEEFQHLLREEVFQVACDYPDTLWKRAGLAAMVKIDSTFRESMRLWGFITRGVLKKVMVKEGITLPSGHHLPQGTNVGVTQYAVHHDNDVYPNAYNFDPLRWCESSDEEGLFFTTDTGAKRPNMVTSSDRFMGFSHGRHAW
jgi:cytochrome P450